LDLSVIVPLYNEEDNVVPLYEAIVAAVRPLGIEHELIFVDDGSKDGTAAIARRLAEGDQRLKVVLMRRNFGQTAAMSAGIHYASGRVLVTMDGDLQNDPADIPLLIRQIHDGYDIVVGWRRRRQDSLITRKIPSRIANWLIAKVTGVAIRDNGCSLKAYRADLIKQIPLYSEMHRFIPAMASISGARVAQIPVRHHARRFGVSKYGLSRIYKVLIDLAGIKALISFANRPAILFGSLAIPAALLSLWLIGYNVYLIIKTGSMAIPLAGTGVLFGALAVFLVMSGLLAELVYRTGNLDVSRMSMLPLDPDRPSVSGDVHDIERNGDEP
jgi:glycosyltransferase involved in cell wall biosynthesis